MPSAADRRPIPTRVKIIMTFIMFVLSAGAIRFAVFVGRKEGFSPKEWPKPFGLGVGPAYIGGRDTVWAGNSLVLELYAGYRKYKVLTQKTTTEEEEYYQRWTSQSLCIGSCGEHALCQDGVCICDGDNEFVHIFGHCLDNSTAFLKQSSSDLKFRKQGDKFDETSLTCKGRDHRSCLDVDTNMYCADSDDCVCRMDMGFNRKTMECELLLDVDCKEETGYDFVTEEDQEIMEIVNGDKEVEDGTTLDKEKVRKGFCVYLDGKAETYNGYRQGEFDLLIWGLALPGFILLLFALVILASTFCFCLFYIMDFIHFCDPRNAMAAITAQQEMSGLA
eukprot:GFUD01007473.1.p1 GENE.GFUD01007473.1~~GFUD01007473.1.p1  ORF type:complete len:334 (+),score=84.19 GFUD01007473.1:264-1265(+)